jgi:hypothetical protein
LERCRHLVEEIGWDEWEVTGEIGSAKAFERFGGGQANFGIVY